MRQELERYKELAKATRCREAEKINGLCRGYQKSRVDDEPAESCKECEEFELYEKERDE